jgi:hypothetical protein
MWRTTTSECVRLVDVGGGCTTKAVEVDTINAKQRALNRIMLGLLLCAAFFDRGHSVWGDVFQEVSSETMVTQVRFETTMATGRSFLMLRQLSFDVAVEVSLGAIISMQLTEIDDLFNTVLPPPGSTNAKLTYNRSNVCSHREKFYELVSRLNNLYGCTFNAVMGLYPPQSSYNFKRGH